LHMSSPRRLEPTAVRPTSVSLNNNAGTSRSPAMISTLLERFLRGEPNMHPEDFHAAKDEFCGMRCSHVRGLTPYRAEWLLTRYPQSAPDDRLLAYDNDRGGTYAVGNCHRLASWTSKFNVTFHQGDMIDHAYSTARSGIAVAVLNMANAFTPGGGFLGGARAQEEQLCHRSNLFPRLKLYHHNQLAHDQVYLAEGTCLVTPHVDILRGGSETGYTELTPASVTVLSAAAESYESESDAQSDPGLPARMIETWRAVLSAAVSAGVEEVVVGALGCGAFNNPPHAVGQALATALLLHGDPGTRLKALRVVIMEDHNSGGRNFEQFEAGFHHSMSVKRTRKAKRKIHCESNERAEFQ